MQKRFLSKLIAIVLLFVLLVPMFGTTVRAVAEEVAINHENTKTSTRYVDANLAFIKDDEVLDYVLADVNSDLKLRIFLDLKDEGYFEKGKIEVKNPEDATYEFVLPDNESDLIQSVDPYLIKLNQIQGISETFIEIPVKYLGIDNVDLKTLLNKSELELTGEYTNQKGDKYDVLKKVSLALNWIDNKEIEISNEINKFIKHEVNSEKEVVLQNLIIVNNKEKEINLPIKKFLMELNLLKLEDKSPKSVNVRIQKADLFNKDEDIVLDENFYTFDEKNNVLKIEIDNAPNSDGTYSSGEGNLEILITSFYDINNDFEEYEGDIDILVKQYVLTGDSKLTEVQKQIKSHLTVDEQIGKMVDINETCDIFQMPKGILYVNSIATNVKENLVKSKTNLDIANVDIIDAIQIIENEPQYNNKFVEKNIIYKTLEINKKDFDNIFENGDIEIYSNKELLGKINNSTLIENDKYVFTFVNPISNITLKTSKPIKEGSMVIEATRSFNKTSLKRSEFKEVKSIEVSKDAYMVYDNQLKLLNKINHTINLVDASSNIVLSTNKKDLSTIKKNEDFEFNIALNNDKLLSDVYAQTMLELVLPKGIKEFTLKSANIIHGSGLTIGSSKVYKEGSKYIVQVLLTGQQDGLSTGYLTNGTNILLNTDITLDQWASTEEVEYSVRYSNVLATNYANQIKWSMSSNLINFEPYGNGIVQGSINYVAPQGVVLVNEFEKINKKEESLISINQGYKEGKIDILTGKRIIDGHIYVLNNNNTEVTSPIILGRIPNQLNKNIITKELLGSTFDMTLASRIVAEKGNYKTYYSENPNATSDLKSENNSWSTSLKIENAKSYLIVLNEKMEKNETIKFNYKMEIPANLEHNQEVKTYNFVEYGVDTTKGNIRYYQMSSPLGLSTGEGVQLDIDIAANKEKVSENEDIVYSLSVLNKAKKTKAKNVESYFKIPDNLTFKGIKKDSTEIIAKLSEDKKGVFLTIGDIEAGETIVKDIVFTAKRVNVDESIELNINITAENFKVVKTKTSLGSKVQSEKMTVILKDLEKKFDPDKVNIYPGDYKDYEIKVENKTFNSLDKNTLELVKAEDFGQVNLSIQLPSTLEYVPTENLLYKVVEYNTIKNIVNIQLLDKELPSLTAVTMTFRVRLKNKLPAEYSKTIKLSVNATTISKTTGKTIYVRSNEITDYIGERKVSLNTQIYSLGNQLGALENSNTVQEYEDIMIKYTISSTYLIQNANFIFRAPEGMTIKSIYKSETYNVPNENDVRHSALYVDTKINKSDIYIYEYPFYIPEHKAITFTVHAYIEGIGNESNKKLDYIIGFKDATRNEMTNTKSLKVIKGNVAYKLQEKLNDNKIKLSDATIDKFGLNNNLTIQEQKLSGITMIEYGKKLGNSAVGKPLGKVIVELVDNNSQKVIAKTVSDDEGLYQFNNVPNGNYSVTFKYNDKKYIPATHSEDGTNKIDVALNNINNKSIAITDGIQVNFASVNNVNLNLVEKSNFDLSLDAEITEITIEKSEKEIKTYNFNERKNVKLELNRSDLNQTKVLVKYKLRAINEGEVDGSVVKINAYIPKGMLFVPELNPLWKIDEENNVYTTALSASNIAPGKDLNLELVLVQEFNKQNLGLSKLGLEISEVKNSLGLDDRDSIPNNKNIEEDDYVRLETILGFNTGKKITYVLLLSTILSTMGTLVFLVLRKINGKEIK